MKLALVVLSASILAASCGSDGDRLVVAAGTTLVDSGVMARVEAAYEAQHPEIDVVVVAGASGTILALGRSGDADVVVSHAPTLERHVLDEVPSATRLDAFVGEFVLVGPAGSALGDITDVVEAFRAIAASGAPFVSRGDASGTAEAEQLIWSAAGINPSGEDWYTVTGSGMGFTLQVADQRSAYTLADAATWTRAELGLVEISLEPSQLLDNPYSVLTFSEAEPVREFAVWLAGPSGDAIVGEFFDRHGGSIFRP